MPLTIDDLFDDETEEEEYVEIIILADRGPRGALKRFHVEFNGSLPSSMLLYMKTTENGFQLSISDCGPEPFARDVIDLYAHNQWLRSRYLSIANRPPLGPSVTENIEDGDSTPSSLQALSEVLTETVRHYAGLARKVIDRKLEVSRMDAVDRIREQQPKRSLHLRRPDIAAPKKRVRKVDPKKHITTVKLNKKQKR